MITGGKITFYCERLSSEKSVAANWLDRLEQTTPQVSILHRPNLTALRWGTMAIDLVYYIQVLTTDDDDDASSNHHWFRNRYARLIYVQLLHELFRLVKIVDSTLDVRATSAPCSLTTLWTVLPWSDVWFFLLLRTCGLWTVQQYDNPVERDLESLKASNFHELYQEWLDLAQEHQVDVPALTYLRSRFVGSSFTGRRLSARELYHAMGSVSPESRGDEIRRQVWCVVRTAVRRLFARGGALGRPSWRA